MYFRVGNKVEVYEPTKAMVEWCKDNLVLNNPEYEKKLRMGLWTGNTPETFCLYERDGKDRLILPFGCVKELVATFPECEFKSVIRPPQPFEYESSINLYPYQKNAVEAALACRNGVIVMPCGAGKTQTGLEIIARLGVKTLWLTHTQDLLNQSMNRARSVFGCFGYGTITGGKVNIGSGLTFATVQTMAKLDLTQYKDTWGCVVVDECHRAVGSPTKVMQFYRVLSNLSCRYKFGLTATPKRADGLQRAMFALLGGVVCEVKKSEVAHTTCPVDVQFVETEYVPDLGIVLAGDGTLNYAGLVDDLTHDEKRFSVVLKTIEQIPANSPTLVLANRVEYLARLNKEYYGISACLSAMGNSKAAKEERKRALKALNDGSIDCLFATYQLAKEGLDVPNLRYVVFATPEKDETTVAQAAGRVGRKAEGKEKGTVIDFVDDFAMFYGWKKKRMTTYRKLDYNFF